MTRFRIQTQFFILGAMYLCLTLLAVIVALAVMGRLVHSAAYNDRVFEQLVSLNDMKGELDQALVDALLFANGSPDAFQSMGARLAQVFEYGAQSVSLLRSADMTQAQNLERAAQVEDTVDALQALSSDIARIGSLSEAARLQEMRDDVFPLLSDQVTQIDAIRDELVARKHQLSDEGVTIISESRRNFLLIGGVAVALSVLLSLIFGTRMARAVVRIAKTVGLLQAGNFETTIPDRSRKDEIGQINAALENFRVNLKDAAALREREALVNERRDALFSTLGTAMASLSDGQLQSRVQSEDWQDLGEAYTRLCDDFNALVARFRSLVQTVRDSALAVESNSGDLSTMSNNMSQRAEVQAATLEQSAAALAEMATGVRDASQRAQDADALVVQGREKAEAGGAVMEKALAAMASIANSSEQINNIIGVIDDIAFQTNLLALNAGVEAARAGPSGKGFSVVASEVRSLAQRASESAREIKALVSDSAQRVQDGGKLVEATSQTLSEIVATVNEVAIMVSEIASSAKEQSTGLEEINVGVSELDRVTQENVASVNELSEASRDLNREARRMTELLSHFQGVSGDTVRTDDVILSSADVSVDPMQAELPTLQGSADFKPARPSARVDSRKVANASAGIWEEF